MSNDNELTQIYQYTYNKIVYTLYIVGETPEGRLALYKGGEETGPATPSDDWSSLLDQVNELFAFKRTVSGIINDDGSDPALAVSKIKEAFGPDGTF